MNAKYQMDILCLFSNSIHFLGGDGLEAKLLEVLVDELIREEKTLNKRGPVSNF